MTDHPDLPMRAVPSGRFARAQHMGGLATGLMGGIALSGAQALLKGQRPRLQDLVMTPANISRLTGRLSEMRGAAMKLGQLLSMEAGGFLSPELEGILSRLRASAHVMPPAQLKQVLSDSYGTDFRTLFRSFDTRPLAAASIGQVHRALTPDGRALAVKLQYPGVRDAIDSDLDNAAALIRWSGLWPRELDIAPLLAEARRQLHEEADYDREGAALDRFGALLGDDPRFAIPCRDAERSRPTALAMSFAPAEPIERLADAPPAIRDAAVSALIELCLNELFTFRVMQTDPNFANYRWNPETGKIVLLDFGATREISHEVSVAYRDLLRAGLAGDQPEVLAALTRIGFIKPDLNARHHAAILDMAEMGFAVLRGPEPFDFRGNDFADRLRARGMDIGGERELWHLPPAETLFLQRKIGGLYLLATRLGARVDVAALVRRFT
ncbi:ABC1 kinase family protein [Roseicyclus sp.]|uniref:ABC1 kinase family protein n=1 Tax=Roseicyclus sp. TaxID=1914329 RepID=UPI003F6C8549